MQRVYRSKFDKFYRVGWIVFHAILIRYSPVPMFKYRAYLYRLWGSDFNKNGLIYPSTRVWDPRQLKVGSGACIGPYANIYNVCQVSIQDGGLVSQYSYLCTASHDFNNKEFHLIGAAISVGVGSWICADCFIGPSVNIEKYAVCLARSVVVKDVQAYVITGGNPSKNIGLRKGVT